MAADHSLPRAFLDEMVERSAAAADACGGAQRTRLRLAGRPMDMTVVGDEFGRRITPALRHAVDAAATGSGLSVVVWDRAASDVLPPALPWSVDDILPTGVVHEQCTDGLWVHYDRWVRLLSIFDPQRSLALVHAADASTLPRWMDRSPLRPVLTRWAAGLGDAVLHASSVVEDGRAVVLAGPSGSGKSTTLMRCLAAGMHTTGDDACIVQFESAVRARPMFGLAKLEVDAADRIEVTPSQMVGDDDGRPVFDLGAALSDNAEVRAVAIVTVGDAPTTTWRSITSSEALRGLVEGSVEEGAGVSLRGLRQLVTAVPCVRLTLGADPLGVVDAVRGLLT